MNILENGILVAHDGTSLARPATESPRESPAKSERARTKKLHESLPEGITIGTWPEKTRRKRFYVRFGDPRCLEGYVSEADRNDRAEELAGTQKAKGTNSLKFDPEEWGAWVEFKNRTGATLPKVEEAWTRYRPSADATHTLAGVVKLFRSKRKQCIRQEGVKHRDLSINRFVEYCKPDTDAQAITDDTINAWLRWLVGKYKLGDQATYHHFSAVRTMFNFPLVKKIVRENPCDFVDCPHPKPGTVHVWTVEQAFRFFKANRDRPEIGRLAIEAFGALRFSSAQRMTAEEIKRHVKGIEMPGLKHKSGKDQFVDEQPRNLWKWIEHAPADCWTISGRSYLKYKSHAFIRSGLVNPRNVIRHTFATMHLSAFKQPGRTATLMQHTSERMMHARYKARLVPVSVGLAYFKITPSTVRLSWERFAALCGLPQQENE